MSDSEVNVKKDLEKLTENPFFTFSKPYLDFIGKGTMFYLIYIVMAVVNLLLPFIILFMIIDAGLFGFGAKFVFAIIFSWIVIVFACWIGFQLWWDRKSKINLVKSDEFVVTPIVSDIVQTFGEWIGTLIAIIGAGVGLIAFIFLGNEMSDFFRYIPGIGFLGSGPAIILIGPVTGLFIIILFRFLAEQMRMLVALVNNTKDIASNLKK